MNDPTIPPLVAAGFILLLAIACLLLGYMLLRVLLDWVWPDDAEDNLDWFWGDDAEENKAAGIKEERRCLHCGSDIEHKHHTAKYCTRKCQQAASSRRQWQRVKREHVRRPIKLCLRCEKPIMGRRHDAIYCSTVCKNRDSAARSQKRRRACAQCGARIDQGKRADAVYCSKSCSKKAHYQRNKANKKP